MNRSADYSLVFYKHGKIVPSDSSYLWVCDPIYGYQDHTKMCEDYQDSEWYEEGSCDCLWHEISPEEGEAHLKSIIPHNSTLKVFTATFEKLTTATFRIYVNDKMLIDMFVKNQKTSVVDFDPKVFENKLKEGDLVSVKILEGEGYHSFVKIFLDEVSPGFRK